MGLTVPDDLRCVAITTGNGPNQGKRCLKQRRRGDTLCDKHLKQREVVEVPATKPTVKPEVAKSQALAVARSAGVEVADPDHLEPVEVMDWCVSQAHFITSEFMSKLRDAPDITADEMAPTVRAALEAIGHARKASEAAESAGMQRRRIVLEEAKVRAVFLAVTRAIQRMGLPDADVQRFNNLIGEELAEVSAA